MKHDNFVETIFELAFGDDAINRGYTEQEVIDKIRGYSDKALVLEKTDEELYYFCKAHYYSNLDTEEECLWQPFENWSDEDIQECIDNDVEALKQFMGGGK